MAITFLCVQQQYTAVPVVGRRPKKIAPRMLTTTSVTNTLVTTCRTTKEGVYMYAQMPRSKWIEKCLGMVTLSGSAIWWTWETEDVFRRVRDGNKYAMKVHAPSFSC